MSDDLDRLEALARAAIPGPWRCDVEAGDEWYFSQGQCVIRPAGADYESIMVGSDDEYDLPTAAYIAAVSPDVVMGLIERLRRLECDHRYLAPDAAGVAPCAFCDEVRP